MSPSLAAVPAEYLIGGAAALISIAAFVMLVTLPALASYGRWWERVSAALLSLYVLAAMAALGVGAGMVALYIWTALVA